MGGHHGRWPQLVQWLCVLVAIALLGWAAALAAQAYQAQQDGERVTGTVVDIREYSTSRSSSGQDRHPTQDVTFEYRLEDRTVRGVWTNDNRSWSVGQRHELLVDPADPDAPYLASSWGLYRMPLALTGVAVTLATSALLVRYAASRRAETPRTRR